MREISPRCNPCYCMNLKRATNSITKLYNKKLDEISLTVEQFSLLTDIKLLGKCSKAELATYAKLDRSTISRNLRVLREKGYISDFSTNESRDSQVSLTTSGAKKLENGCLLWNEAQKYIQEKVGDENMKQLRETLNMIENLS